MHDHLRILGHLLLLHHLLWRHMGHHVLSAAAHALRVHAVAWLTGHAHAGVLPAGHAPHRTTSTRLHAHHCSGLTDVGLSRTRHSTWMHHRLAHMLRRVRHARVAVRHARMHARLRLVCHHLAPATTSLRLLGGLQWSVVEGVARVEQRACAMVP